MRVTKKSLTAEILRLSIELEKREQLLEEKKKRIETAIGVVKFLSQTVDRLRSTVMILSTYVTPREGQS